MIDSDRPFLRAVPALERLWEPAPADAASPLDPGALRAAELDARERELVRREEAAARWFSELSRIQQLLEQERRALDARGS